MGRVTLTKLPHPLTLDGREVIDVAPAEGETALALAKRHGLNDAAITVNGKPANALTVVQPGDVVVARRVVHGPLVALALAFATYAASSYILPLLILNGFSVAFAHAAALAVAVVGGLLVMRLLMPPKPPGQVAAPAREDRFLVSGAKNRDRTFDPFLLIIGRMRVAPDLSGKPYARFIGQEHYLWQSFCFGLQDDLHVEDVRIGKAPIGSFHGVDMTWSTNGVLPTEFGDVDALNGVEVTHAGGAVEFPGSANTISVGVDLVVVAYYSNDRGGVDGRSVSVLIEIVSDGGTVFTSQTHTIPGRSVNQNRVSYEFGVPTGTYRVRVTKTSGDPSSHREKGDMQVASVRFHQEDRGDYEGQKRLGIKIRASNQLSGALDNINAMCWSEIPDWDGSAWVTRATSNPAAWLLWFLRGKRSSAGHLLYGCGLDDIRIDMASIRAFSNWCVLKNLTSNMVIDRQMTRQQVIDAIARCGRGRATWQSGKLGVVWDADNMPVTAMFGPHNIVAGSFKVNYIAEQIADQVVVNFINADNDYEPDSVRVDVLGVQNPSNPATIDFFGCTNADMAGREARLIAASQVYHRKHVEWQTDIEGLVCGIGDVVRLSHDMTGWSHSGRVVRAVSSTELELDAEVPAPVRAYIMIRTVDGSMVQSRVVHNAGNNVTLLDAVDTSGIDGDAMWFYDAGGLPGREYKIIDVSPAGEMGFAFKAIPYVPEYFATEHQWVVHRETKTVRGRLEGGRLLATPVSLSASEFATYDRNGVRHPRLRVLWSPVFDAVKYGLSMRFDGGDWSAREVLDTAIEMDASRGVYDFEVAAIGADGATSSPAATTLQVLDGSPPADEVFGFLARVTSNGVLLQWDRATHPEHVDTEIRKGATVEGSTLVTRKLSQTHLTGWLPAGLSVFWARHWNPELPSPTWARAQIGIAPPATPSILRSEASFNVVSLAWTDAKTDQPISAYSISIGLPGQTLSETVVHSKVGGDSRSALINFDDSGDRLIFLRAQDVAGNWGVAQSVVVNIKLPNNFGIRDAWDAMTARTDTNAAYVDGGVHLPLDTTKTWREHFAGNRWSNIADQLRAGFTQYFMPAPTSGSVMNVHDLGAIVAVGQVTSAVATSHISGHPVLQTQIAVSADGYTWTTAAPNAAEMSAKNFRFVRFTLSVSGSGNDDLVHIDSVRMSVRMAEQSESGRVVLNSADANGTFYAATKDWLDVVSATVTPLNSPNIVRTNVNILDTATQKGAYVQAWDASNRRTGGTVSIQLGGF